jgi:hypothetical protein
MPRGIGPSSDDVHDIALYKGESLPRGLTTARDYLNNCPESVRAKFRNILIEVAKAPPKKFSGGGYWQAMHGNLKGWYEVRALGPSRTHHRLFCILDYSAMGSAKPLLVVITGLSKANGVKFSKSDYAKVLKAGNQYLSSNPRQIE